MNPIYRLLAIVFIWIVIGVLGFFALGQSLFMPQQTVTMLFVVTMLSGVAATFFVSRINMQERS
jgi:hypothetical protein